MANANKFVSRILYYHYPTDKEEEEEGNEYKRFSDEKKRPRYGLSDRLINCDAFIYLVH